LKGIQVFQSNEQQMEMSQVILRVPINFKPVYSTYKPVYSILQNLPAHLLTTM